MATESTFTCFPLLPTELRLEIWWHALNIPAVWGAVKSEVVQHRRSNLIIIRKTMGYIGPAPDLVGLTCREARSELKKSHIFIPPHREPLPAWKYRDVYCVRTGGWINPDQTIVYLGGKTHQDLLRFSFDSGVMAKFKAVALAYSTMPELEFMWNNLARSCPDVRCIILEDQGTETQSTIPADIAARYAALASANAEYDRHGQGECLKKMLRLYFFEEESPMIHLLAREGAQPVRYRYHNDWLGRWSSGVEFFGGDPDRIWLVVNGTWGSLEDREKYRSFVPSGVPRPLLR